MKWVALLLLMPAAANAEEVVFSCRLTGVYLSTTKDDPMLRVNQIIVNDEVPSITFRAAETIGTSDPLEWVYADGGEGGQKIIFSGHPRQFRLAGTNFTGTMSVFNGGSGEISAAFTSWDIKTYDWMCKP